MARLVVNPGSPAAWEIQLKPGDNFLGRGFSNDFKFTDPSVSTSHCQIKVSPGGAVIKDLGSTNGTYVNRAPVREAALQAGQSVHLGGVEMVFYSDGPSPAASIQTAPPVRMVGAPVRATVAPIAPRAAASTTTLPPPAPALPPVTAPPPSAPQHAGGQYHPKVPASFFARMFTAFAYPLEGDGLILLVAGTVFFCVLDAAKFFAAFAGIFGLVAILILFVIGTGYLTCYLRRIVTSTAMGESKMPDWPDVTDLGSDVLAPFFQLLGTVLACFLPAIAVSIVAASGFPIAAWLLIPAAAFGCVYFPMAFLAVAMLDTIVAVNPLVVLPTILRVPLGYFVTLVLFVAVIGLRVGGELFLPAVLPFRFLSAIVLNLLGLYFLTVEMRVLGLLYLTNKHKFGWLSR